MVTLLKTPLFALFLFVFMLPLCLGIPMLLPDLAVLRDDLAGTEAMVSAAEFVERALSVRRNARPVDPFFLASVLVLLPVALVALFLAHRVSVWMVMPVGGGGRITLPVDGARWLGGLLSRFAFVGLGLGVLAASIVFEPAMTISDHATPLGVDTRVGPAWPMLLPPAVGCFMALGGMMLSLRAAGITTAPGRSLTHAVWALGLAAISPYAVVLLVHLMTAAGPVREMLVTHAGWLTLGHAWALASGAVIAFQVSFTVLSTRAHLARRVQRLAREELRTLSSAEALAMADRSISQRRLERLHPRGGRGMGHATA